MASVRQLPSGKWNAQVRIKGYPTKTATRSTREEVEQWAIEQERDIKKEANTIESLKAIYLEEVMIRNGKQRGGYESAKFKLNTVGRILNGKTLESLTSEDAVAYRQARIKEVSGSTVRLEMQLLSRFLRWANTEWTCLGFVPVFLRALFVIKETIYVIKA